MRPEDEMGGGEVEDEEGEKEGEEEVDDAEGEDGDGGAVAGLGGGFGWWSERCGAREEEKEEEESSHCVVLAFDSHALDPGYMINLHDCKTSPLHPHLRYTQQARHTVKATHLPAACQCFSAGR